MDIPSRSLVSVVGASGCGKSTLASLFMGYQTAQSGKVLICGKDIRMIPVKERMKQMTLVSFQNYLFKGSVRENLLMGDPSATEEKLLAVLKKLICMSFSKRRTDWIQCSMSRRQICLVDRNRDFVSQERFFMTVHSIF